MWPKLRAVRFVDWFDRELVWVVLARRKIALEVFCQQTLKWLIFCISNVWGMARDQIKNVAPNEVEAKARTGSFLIFAASVRRIRTARILSQQVIRIYNKRKWSLGPQIITDPIWSRVPTFTSNIEAFRHTCALVHLFFFFKNMAKCGLTHQLTSCTLRQHWQLVPSWMQSVPSKAAHRT